MKKTNTTTTTTTTNRPTFDTVKRAFETAYRNGDYTAELTALAQAVASSVIRKCADPTAKNATTAEKVSNNGCNPAMVQLKRAVHFDLAHLADLAHFADLATKVDFTADGDCVTVIADADAETAVVELVSDTLQDGIDLVNTAVVALLEQAEEHAHGENWLDTTYTVRRLSKKVLIRDDASAEWKDMDTTPMQEVYKAVRRYIQQNASASIDPRNGYLYLEELASDPESDALETVYRRLGKCADMGGYSTTIDGKADYAGLYTADRGTVETVEFILAQLALTDRQLAVVKLRMRGYGYKAIATYLGVTHNAVINCLCKVQAKAEKIGFTPSMWADMNGEN